MFNKKIAGELAVGVILLIVIAIGGIFYWQNKSVTRDRGQGTGNEQKACTEEARICPDGSVVGRTGPNCEFSQCPAQDDYKCSQESDCELMYVTDFPCGPCKAIADIEKYECFSPEAAAEMRKKIGLGRDFLCEACAEITNLECTCDNGTCKKVEKTSMQIANPASVYCVENGGKSEIITEPDGSQTGFCKFDNGSQCEEWAYFRKECEKIYHRKDFKEGWSISPDPSKRKEGTISEPDGTTFLVWRNRIHIHIMSGTSSEIIDDIFKKIDEFGGEVIGGDYDLQNLIVKTNDEVKFKEDMKKLELPIAITYDIVLSIE